MGIIVSEQDFLNTYKNKIAGCKALNLCKKNKWLPLKASPLIASIVGHLMGDGNLSKDRMVGDFRFYANLSELNKIRYKLKRQLKLISYACYPHPKGGCFILKYNNAIFSRILELIGVPRGDKILTVFNIPKWIFKGNKEIKRSFLAAILGDEIESLRLSKNHYDGFRFQMSKKIDKTNDLVKFLIQIKYLLKELDIRSTKVTVFKNKRFLRKDSIITLPAYFFVSTDLENRKKFYFNVGLDDEEKQKVLYNSIYK